MANANRNTNIDLYRIVLMLGICLLHCVHQGIYQCRPLTMSLLFCVDGFVFISGWCGIRFSWGKVLRLHGVAAYAAIVCALYSMAGGNCSTGAFLQTAFNLWKGFWFLHAYVLLMLVSPCINAAFESLSEGKLFSVALPLLAIPFCWSFAHDVPLLRRFVPDTEGLSAYSGLTFIGVYVAGRLARRFESRIVPNVKILLISISALTVICALGFGRYHSPFAMLLAACWFFIFKLASPQLLHRIVVFMIPSVFPIYLFHSHGAVGFPVIRQIQEFLSRMTVGNDSSCLKVIAVWMSSAIIIFAGGLLLDLPRRMVVCLVARLTGRKVLR